MFLPMRPSPFLGLQRTCYRGQLLGIWEYNRWKEILIEKFMRTHGYALILIHPHPFVEPAS